MLVPDCSRFGFLARHNCSSVLPPCSTAHDWCGRLASSPTVNSWVISQMLLRKFLNPISSHGFKGGWVRERQASRAGACDRRYHRGRSPSLSEVSRLRHLAIVRGTRRLGYQCAVSLKSQYGARTACRPSADAFGGSAAKRKGRVHNRNYYMLSCGEVYCTGASVMPMVSPYPRASAFISGLVVFAIRLVQILLSYANSKSLENAWHKELHLARRRRDAGWE